VSFLFESKNLITGIVALILGLMTMFLGLYFINLSAHIKRRE